MAVQLSFTRLPAPTSEGQAHWLDQCVACVQPRTSKVHNKLLGIAFLALKASFRRILQD